MGRAELAALKAYPEQSRYYRDYEQLAKRQIFEQGYAQAEKDLGWHSVDDSLPPIDEEVIALTDEMNGNKLSNARRICYAHRPDPNGWDGRDIDTGKVKHYDVITYDGWNVPGVKYWMYIPKLKEERQ